jgi:hypothetical protein
MANVIEGPELLMQSDFPQDILQLQSNRALAVIQNQLGRHVESGLGKAIFDYTQAMGVGRKTEEVKQARAIFNNSIIKPMNERARRVRDIERTIREPGWLDAPVMDKSAMAKAVLDIGTLTNFSNITGGQSLGYVSLDTRMARGTVRPNSFTLYQALEKSLAWQVVDYWALANATGGSPPGSAFANYSSVTSGALTTNAGSYNLMNIVLKLVLDGRAITTALAAQNNYVNVSEQENVNAALSVLSSVNWANYLGNSNLFANQFDGIVRQITSNSLNATNEFDFYKFSNANSARSWSPELTLYNLIYEAAAQITSFGQFGRITHAFMSPAAMGSFQGLTTTQLNNVITQITDLQNRNPLLINGELIGMQTRTGHVQFPLDLFIDSRMLPVEAFSASQATTVAPTIPTSIVGSVNAPTVVGSEWNGSYVASGNSYYYGVVACDASMNESQVTFTSGAVGPVASGGSVSLVITPAATDAVAFRVFRSGLGYSGTPAAKDFRWIGDIKANGASAVTFVDLNGGSNATILANNQTECFIPGSTPIFLLDMDPTDLAIDFRALLPLVRVELFANNLFMPWAVAMIGALRMRVPKFHGYIKNYVPSNPEWNPLDSNL